MSDSNNIPAGGESLNERLRRAAEMARRNMASQDNGPAQPVPGGEAPRIPEQPRVAPQQPAPEAHTSTFREQPRVAPQQPYVATQQPVPGAQTSTFREQPYVAPQQPRVAPPPPLDPVPPHGAPSPKKSKTGLLIGIIVAVVILAAAAVFFILQKSNETAAQQQQQIEQLQLQNEQIQLANEYDALNNEFAQYENQTSLLANDSIVQKYAAARAQVEKLLEELKNEKNKSAAQIAQLKGEIETLKAILRTYVEQINELKKENQSLRDENQEVKAQNTQLTQTVQNVQATNQHLNERMTLAEKLNVTGVNLQALNKKGKVEKNVTKARQLMVTFTIPQNNSTPVGEKTIYCRIVSPEGELLGNAGTFSFEGASLQASAKKQIEYQGEEIGGIKIYWDVSATLNPGEYTVELFADNYRLASRRFTLSK